MSSDEAWGQLVSLTDFESPPSLLSENVFKIGRAVDCDLPFPNNKLVSGHHCHIERDDGGTVHLVDTSTNGTLLNMNTKISKGKREELKHGDEFFVVFKKDNEELNIGFVYQDLSELAKEDSSSVHDMDATLEDSDCNYVSPVKEDKKRKSEDVDDADTSCVKKPRPDSQAEAGGHRTEPSSNVDDIPTDKSGSQQQKGEGRKPRADKTDEKCNLGSDSKEIQSSDACRKTDEKKETTDSIIANEADKVGTSGVEIDKKNTAAVSTTTNSASTGSSLSVTTAAVTSTATAATMAGSSGSTAIPSSAGTSDLHRDDMEETLQCLICQDIMHDCISLQPCLHCYCSGCYSGWMKKSDKCPSCRQKVKKINKNHMVNNLIEAYLKSNPGKKRSDEDLQELDAKNTITKDMLYRYDRDMDYESNSSDYDSDGEEVEQGGGGGGGIGIPPNPAFGLFPPAAPPQPVVFGFGTPIFGVNRAFKTVCRQCPEYKADNTDKTTGVVGGIKNVVNAVKTFITGAGDQPATEACEEPADTDGTQDYDTTTQVAGPSGVTNEGPNNPGPSTSGEGDKPSPERKDEKVMPDAPAHQCGPVQNHVLCQCCLQPFPDFRASLHPPDNRPQQCGLCYRAYCHAYWGCRKNDCLGCLNEFQDMNFGRKALAGLIMENQYESEIFKDYIDAKGMSVKDVLHACCREMEAGKISVPAQASNRFNVHTPVCYNCGLNAFKQLAFQYRKTMKKEDFPENVRNRPDCYWGSKCRTQRNKPHHAKNYNHICDQTRQY